RRMGSRIWALTPPSSQVANCSASGLKLPLTSLSASSVYAPASMTTVSPSSMSLSAMSPLSPRMKQATAPTPCGQPGRRSYVQRVRPGIDDHRLAVEHVTVRHVAIVVEDDAVHCANAFRPDGQAFIRPPARLALSLESDLDAAVLAAEPLLDQLLGFEVHAGR